MPDPREPIARRAFLNHVAVLGAAAAGGIGVPDARAERRVRRRVRPHLQPRRRSSSRRSPSPSCRRAWPRVATRRGASSEQYLARIAAMDRTGPSLHAIIETNPDALELAEQLDEERAAKGPRGPLHGIPVLLKDNIDTADRMTTTAGSLALEGSIAPQDSHVAERLRAAGASCSARRT